MRALAWLLCAWLALGPAFADSAFVAPTANGAAAVGQLPGTATNDVALAGKVGEIIQSITSAAGTATITIATPAVITMTGNTYSGYSTILFSTTGALPTGIVAGTVYYTSCPAVNGSNACGNSFSIATSIDNAIAGTLIATSGTQSGTQTGTSIFGMTAGPGAAFNIAGLPLTAGAWDIVLSGDMSPASTTLSTASDVSISTTSATRNGVPTIAMARFAPWYGTVGLVNVTAGPLRVNLSATTTYYGVAQSNFTVSTATFNGSVMRATRVR